MKIEQMFDESRVNDAEYLKNWVKCYHQMITANPSFDGDWDEIVEDLESHDIEKTGDANGWRPFACDYFLGHEGGGENVYIVFGIAKEESEEILHFGSSFVSDAIVYFKINGYYSSYDGVSWRGKAEIVEPTVRTIVTFDKPKRK